MGKTAKLARLSQPDDFIHDADGPGHLVGARFLRLEDRQVNARVRGGSDNRSSECAPCPDASYF